MFFSNNAVTVMALTVRLSLVVFATTTAADSWVYEKKLTDKEYHFGETRIVRSTDAREDQQYPDFTISMYRDNQLLAKYRDVSFNELFASEDNEFFLGLSNSGIPGTAIVLFNSDGDLMREIKHQYFFADYCTRSVTLERVWYSEENPDISFDISESYGHKYIKSINLRDCNGNLTTLQAIIDNGQLRYLQFRNIVPSLQDQTNSE